MIFRKLLIRIKNKRQPYLIFDDLSSFVKKRRTDSVRFSFIHEFWGETKMPRLQQQLISSPESVDRSDVSFPGRSFRLSRRMTLLVSAVMASPVLAGGGGQNMLLVVNPNDENAVRVAQAYMLTRNIPQNNVVFVNVDNDMGVNTPKYQISGGDLVSKYIQPIQAHLAANGLTGQIDYIATLGQPYKVVNSTPSGSYAMSLTFPPPPDPGEVLGFGWVQVRRTGHEPQASFDGSDRQQVASDGRGTGQGPAVTRQLFKRRHSEIIMEQADMCCTKSLSSWNNP